MIGRIAFLQSSVLGPRYLHADLAAVLVPQNREVEVSKASVLC